MKRFVTPALSFRNRRAVGPTVVDELMHVPAQEIIGRFVAEHSQTCRIAKCAIARIVQAKDGFRGRIEQQSNLLLTFP